MNSINVRTKLVEALRLDLVGPGNDHAFARELLPEVFYDPRALAPTTGERASLHTKCVIVDRKTTLVTSPNFTQAAQEKNIEAGVLVRDTGFVGRLSGHFDALIAAAIFQQCQL